ncbi:hypothetical protein CDL15_Pgr017795 [Punica granatum]|uniref:Uncharacterized protein n=1 Tax=Punica granatum TaxID=22663 RepID=A0A218WIQ9_PUNGR|nr:hypothetical protein CDL15_Pgr017795 [Punica granatum]
MHLAVPLVACMARANVQVSDYTISEGAQILVNKDQTTSFRRGSWDWTLTSRDRTSLRALAVWLEGREFSLACLCTSGLKNDPPNAQFTPQRLPLEA